MLCRAVIRRRSRRQEAGGSPVHKHCPHPCSWLLQQQALAAEIMRKMLTPVARLVAVTLASLVTTASAEGSTIVAGSKGITTNYSHVIHYIVFQLSSLNLDINLTSSGHKRRKHVPSYIYQISLQTGREVLYNFCGVNQFSILYQQKHPSVPRRLQYPCPCPYLNIWANVQ